jgi:hypothetical protein
MDPQAIEQKSILQVIAEKYVFCVFCRISANTMQRIKKTSPSKFDELKGVLAINSISCML